ncbi:CBS domain-containing protein [Aliikangiella sp. IMCC44653]
MPQLSSIMTANPISISNHANINRARLLMTEKKIRHLPVKDSESGKLVGILSQKAVLANAIKILNQRGFDQLEHCEKSMDVASIMTVHPTTCDLSDSIKVAAAKLLEQRSGCVAIEDKGELVGIITSSDFVKLAIASGE